MVWTRYYSWSGSVKPSTFRAALYPSVHSSQNVTVVRSQSIGGSVGRSPRTCLWRHPRTPSVNLSRYQTPSDDVLLSRNRPSVRPSTYVHTLQHQSVHNCRTLTCIFNRDPGTQEGSTRRNPWTKETGPGDELSQARPILGFQTHP